jgi:hypothetical protein
MEAAMKQTEKTAVTADRRAFLKLAGAGAVTGGAALVGTSMSAEALAATGGESKETLYRETEHVKRYYDLARS